MIHTRASAVRSFYQSVERELDEGWEQFRQSQIEKTRISNARMWRLLQQIKGREFADQLWLYMRTVKAKDSMLRVTRNPSGIRVLDRRFALIPHVWVEQKECEDGRYSYVCIQVKPDRWIKFVVWY